MNENKIIEKCCFCWIYGEFSSGKNKSFELKVTTCENLHVCRVRPERNFDVYQMAMSDADVVRM